MVKEVLRLNGSDQKMRSTSGFSLLELIAVIAIIGLVAMIGVPRFIRQAPDEQKVFVSQLNALLATARSDALLNGKMQKVLFDFDDGTVTLHQAKEKGALVDTQEGAFELRSSGSGKRHINIPSIVTVQNFYTGTIDEGGSTTKKVWFFLDVRGVSQMVTIVCYNAEQGAHFSLQMNPFTGQVKVYDEAIKPGA